MNWKVKVGGSAIDSPASKPQQAATIAAWLKRLCLGPVVELRAIGVVRRGTDARHVEHAVYPTTPDGLLRMSRDARDLSTRAEGVYFTLNPIRPDLQGYATDVDITTRTWMLVDVDPVRPAGVSATAAEKDRAADLAALVRDHLESLGVSPTAVADSGNGFHLLYRIDLPAGSTLVPAVLKALAGRFDDDHARIDVAVGNPSRICKVYGTIARKGPDSADRPHRRSDILELYPDEIVPASVLESLLPRPTIAAANPTPAPPPSSRWAKTAVADADPIDAHASKALELETLAVANAPSGRRNNQLIASACALHELANAGSLDAAEVDSRLRTAARSAGLKDPEIDATLASARRRTEGKARDLSHVGKGKPGRPSKRAVVDPATGLREPVDDERRLARLFLASRCRHEDGCTLRFWNDDWWRWDAGAYRILGDKEIKAGVVATSKAELERHARAVDADILPFGSRHATNVVESLRSLTFRTIRQTPCQPSWIDEEGPPPAECLNFRNGILHLPTLLAEGPEKALRAPTPRYFAANVLDYDFHASAPKPIEWFKFLDSIWGRDPESVEALQQWFGYLLTPDTSRQKILAIVGPPRSGKGTILRLLSRLIGPDNVVGTTLTDLGNHFGLQDLIGKSVAYFGESRLTGRGDTQAVVERLLSISGEDLQSVPRKNAPSWQGRLATRFVMLANETPRLGDVSDALMSRLVVLVLTESFQGREDDDLDAKLAAELPGILLWSIQGWADLRESGRFLQPVTGATAREEMREANNPMAPFVDEVVEFGVDLEVKRSTAFKAWEHWCRENGRHGGSNQTFYGLLRVYTRNQGIEIYEGVTRRDGKSIRVIKGLRIDPDVARIVEQRSREGTF